MSAPLIVLTADVDIEAAVRTLIEKRTRALQVAPIEARFLRHPNKGPGCYHQPMPFLRGFADGGGNALVVLDEAWEGAPSAAPDMELSVEGALAADWGERARCIVIAPEVESWVFSDSPQVATVLGWAERKPDLREWLRAESLWGATPKPSDPKIAFERALKEVKRRPTAQYFLQLAEKVSVERCTDRAFARLRDTLRAWYPPVPGVAH